MVKTIFFSFSCDRNALNNLKLTDNALMWLEYKDGMKGTFWMSKTATGNRNDLKLKIYGEKASAEWSHNNPEELYLSYNNGVRQIVDRGSKCLVANEKRYNRYRVGHPAGFIEAFANLYLDIPSGEGEYTNFIYDIEKTRSSLPLTNINLTPLNDFSIKIFENSEELIFNIDAKTETFFSNPNILIHMILTMLLPDSLKLTT